MREEITLLQSKCPHSGFIHSELQFGVYQLGSFLDTPHVCSLIILFWYFRGTSVGPSISILFLRLVEKHLSQENCFRCSCNNRLIMPKCKMLPWPERPLSVSLSVPLPPLSARPPYSLYIAESFCKWCLLSLPLLHTIYNHHFFFIEFNWHSLRTSSLILSDNVKFP